MAVWRSRGAGVSDTQGKVLIVTKMKNEGPFILEWLAHHLAIGVTDFLIYSNDCTDGTDDLLDVLQKRGLVAHRQNPFRKVRKSIHNAVYSACLKEPVYRQADWLLTMDVDEFIDIHVGEGHLSDLFGALPEANLISMTWRLFGNSHIHGYEDHLVTERFTRCARPFNPRPLKAWCFKTLFRNNGIYGRLDTHRPKRLDAGRIDEIHWVNGSGTVLRKSDDLLKNRRRSNPHNVGFDLVTLNHYAVRSAQSFIVKCDRGDAQDTGQIDLMYWFNLNNNGAESESIHRRLPKTRAVLEDLMSDPAIRNAHKRCVRRHRRAFADLVARPEMQRLYDTITSPRMERLSEMHHHFAQSVFQDPDGLEKLPPDFTDMQIGPNHVFTARDGEHYPGDEVELFRLDPFYEPARRDHWR